MIKELLRNLMFKLAPVVMDKGPTYKIMPGRVPRVSNLRDDVEIRARAVKAWNEVDKVSAAQQAVDLLDKKCIKINNTYVSYNEFMSKETK